MSAHYRRIDEDIFGKSYEMFLASNRKDAGIYYTPEEAARRIPIVNSLSPPQLAHHGAHDP